MLMTLEGKMTCLIHDIPTIQRDSIPIEMQEHVVGVVRKQDHRAITINNKQDANIKTHYKRDTNITWFIQDGLCPHRNFQSFVLYCPTK